MKSLKTKCSVTYCEIKPIEHLPPAGHRRRNEAPCWQRRVGLAKVGRARFCRAIIITHTLGNHGCPRSDLQDCAPRPRRGSLRQDRPPHRHCREGCRPRRCRPRPAEGASRCKNSRYRIRPKQRPAIGVPSDALGELAARRTTLTGMPAAAMHASCDDAPVAIAHRGARPIACAARKRAHARGFSFLRDERLGRGLPTGRATRARMVDR